MITYRGTLVSFNAGTFLASVRLTGSGAQAIASVPVSRAIPAAELVAGRTVLVALQAGGGPSLGIVFAVAG